MKKLLLLLTLLVSFGGMVHAAEESYTIKFKTGSNTMNNFSASTIIADVVTEGAQYITSVKSASNAFPTTAEGIRVGSKSGAGNVIFNLSETGQVNATKIVVNAKGNSSTSHLDLTEAASKTSGTAIETSGFKDYTFTMDSSSKLTELKLYGFARVFITSITVYYESGGEQPGPQDYKPAFSDLTLHTGDTQTLSLGANHPENITFTSDSQCVTVDANGTITAVAEGTATITATWDAIADTWNAGSKTFTVTVDDSGTLAKPYTASQAAEKATDTATEVYVKGYITAVTNFNSTYGSITYYIADENDATSKTLQIYAGLNIDAAKFNSISDIEVGAYVIVKGNLKLYNGSAELDKNNVIIEYTAPKTDPIEYTPNFGDVTLEEGQTHQIELGESHPAVLFISNDETIATVDESTGLIKAVAAGTTDITATWDADETWNEGEVSFKVTVTKPLADPQFSFRHDVVYGKLGVGVVGQAGRHLGDGKTSYSSSDETVVSVNPNTGMITPADVHKVGTATITANLEATADYKAATASYTVVIEAPNQGISDDEPVTFDFTTTSPYGLDPKSQSNDYETSITEITSETPITLSFTGRYRNWGADKDFRLYPASQSDPAATMTIAVPDGFTITKITLNQTRGTFTADNGTVGTEHKEWNAATADGVQKVTFTITEQLRIKTMTVGLKKQGSTLLPAQLSFTNKTYNELVNTDIIVNAVNNPNNVGQIYYSIDNLTEGEDYTIMSQGDNLKLNVKEIGVYTLRAKSEATDTYLDGFAILRLNVFPQLTMNVDGSEPTTNEDGVVLPAEGGLISLDGEYPNTVKLFYSLNDGEEMTYDGTPIEILDDAKLTYHMEYAETAAYRHTSIKNVLVTPAKPICDTAEGTNVSEGDILTFSSKEGTTLYYKVEIRQPAQAAAHRAPALDGWTSAGGNTYSYAVPALNDGEIAVVTTKAVKGNLESEETAYGVNSSGITTGVEAIEAEGNEAAEVEWFTLQGVRVENPAQGLYIRRQGNKVEKVVVK